MFQGEAFYATAGTSVHGLHKDTPDAIDKMAADVEAQKAKREKFSRWAILSCPILDQNLGLGSFPTMLVVPF